MSNSEALDPQADSPGNWGRVIPPSEGKNPFFFLQHPSPLSVSTPSHTHWLVPFPLVHVRFPCDTHHHTWAHRPIHFLELPFRHTTPAAILLYLPADRTPTVFRRTVCLLWSRPSLFLCRILKFQTPLQLTVSCDSVLSSETRWGQVRGRSWGTEFEHMDSHPFVVHLLVSMAIISLCS